MTEHGYVLDEKELDARADSFRAGEERRRDGRRSRAGRCGSTGSSNCASTPSCGGPVTGLSPDVPTRKPSKHPKVPTHSADIADCRQRFSAPRRGGPEPAGRPSPQGRSRLEAAAKGKPTERWGRKVTGLPSHGLHDSGTARCQRLGSFDPRLGSPRRVIPRSSHTRPRSPAGGATSLPRRAQDHGDSSERSGMSNNAASNVIAMREFDRPAPSPAGGPVRTTAQGVPGAGPGAPVAVGRGNAGQGRGRPLGPRQPGHGPRSARSVHPRQGPRAVRSASASSRSSAPST